MGYSDKLLPTHPIRLGLALNYSVFKYEILQEKQQALDTAKDAFLKALEGSEQSPEENYRDSKLILQLLRDNLTLWSQESGNTDGDA
ncbi:14-3-3 protein [Podila humilis]|nr:14-3-3 protein [Podila humilis]